MGRRGQRGGVGEGVGEGITWLVELLRTIPVMCGKWPDLGVGRGECEAGHPAEMLPSCHSGAGQQLYDKQPPADECSSQRHTQESILPRGVHARPLEERNEKFHLCTVLLDLEVLTSAMGHQSPIRGEGGATAVLAEVTPPQWCPCQALCHTRPGGPASTQPLQFRLPRRDSLPPGKQAGRPACPHPRRLYLSVPTPVLG